MQNRIRLGLAIAVVCVLLISRTFVAEAKQISSSSPATQSPKNSAEAYCIRPIGDFNGDGVADHAISARNASYPSVAIIFLGGEITFSEDIDLTDLVAAPDAVVIWGPAAAPFMCPPEFAEPVARMEQFRTLQVLPAPDASPIGRPTYYKRVVLDATETYPAGYPDANGINAKGHVVGGLNGRAILYDGSSIRSLGTLGGDSSEAFDINSYDDVVGVSLTAETDEYGLISRPFIHDGFQMDDLGIRFGSANSINDNDQIVGGMQIENDGMRLYRAFLYEAGRTRELGTLGGPQSEAHAINSTGEVVGRSSTFIAGTHYESTRAFMYQEGVMNDLGALGHICSASDDEEPRSCYEESVATALNDKGQIVGFSTTDSGAAHAFLFDQSTMKDLGTLGGGQSWAYAINSSGQIVGTSLDAGENYAPFIYTGGAMYNLNELIINLPEIPYPPYMARAINDFGQIAGTYLILDPVYEQISQGGEFAFQETLGQQLNLEYWISPQDGAGPRSKPTWVLLQVKVEVPDDLKERSPLRKLWNRWLPLDHLAPARDWERWRQAAIALPEHLRGKSATIRIRAKNVGFPIRPVVYLRNFNMKE